MKQDEAQDLYAYRRGPGDRMQEAKAFLECRSRAGRDATRFNADQLCQVPHLQALRERVIACCQFEELPQLGGGLYHIRIRKMGKTSIKSTITLYMAAKHLSHRRLTIPASSRCAASASKDSKRSEGRVASRASVAAATMDDSAASAIVSQGMTRRSR